MKHLSLLAALLLGLAFAQPYLASGGFAAPTKIGHSPTVTDIAVATDGGVVYAYWDSGDGIVRQTLTGPSAGRQETVLDDPYLRRLMALTVDGDVALAWVNRSNLTGRSEHVVQWRGETRLVLEDAAPRPLAIGAGPEGPAVLYVLNARGIDTLYLEPWSGEPIEVASSEESIEKFSLAWGEDGTYHIAWLEGFTDRTAAGFASSEWSAYYRALGPDGALGPRLRLGLALNRGLSDTTVVGVTDSTPYVMWPYTEGQEGPVGVALATPGEPARLLARGSGFGITVHDGYAYWAQGESIRRKQLALEDGAAETDSAETSNVLWSPSPIERAAATAQDGELYLVWYGPTRGLVAADYAVYTSDTTAPFQPGWQDRLAARMGWNPWSFWAALGGQVVACLFIGVAAAVVLLPLFWLLSTLLGGRLRRGAALGVALSAGTIVLVSVLIAVRAGGNLAATPVQLAVILLIAAALAYLVCRRANTEVQTQALLGAAFNTFIAVSLLSFLNFQTWSGLWAVIG